MSSYPDLQEVAAIAAAAGEKIMSVYDGEVAVEYKDDKSPLTEADKRSHLHIKQELTRLYPDIPILSEEGAATPWEVRSAWDLYFLVDPLDGTKEFIKRNGEFTVNIALIENKRPIMGVVYAPAAKIMYSAEKSGGVYKQTGEGPSLRITPKPFPESGSISVVGSRSHQSPPFHEYVKKLEETYSRVDVVSKGSSLKLCLVAEGAADIYPRLGPTMEWDTAAAHAVALAAGKTVTGFNTGLELLYNKENLLNDWFIVK